MKNTKYLIVLISLVTIIASCEKGAYENVDVQKPYTYSDLYYENLRDYKATEHTISFGWFAQYGAGSMNSMATRFMGLPDSLDICSLWGGIPSDDALEEMRYVQKTKGTKMLSVAIVRIQAESICVEAKDLFNAGEIEKAVQVYGDYFLNQVYEYDLDGFDMDYEPEGDGLSGNNFQLFVEYLAKYLGPNPDITDAERVANIKAKFGNDVDTRYRMLCVDSNGQVDGNANVQKYCDYYFRQTYGGSASSISGWPDKKVVHCCNMGDYWSSKEANGLYSYAEWANRTGGGFGAFYIHRDYNVHTYSPYPYKRFRECIQMCNPAVK